jgi:predicted permease
MLTMERFFAEFVHDVRYAFRTLVASPGFTVVALLSLGLGICIATCAYSEMSGLLRDLPGVPNPDELVALHSPVSYPTYKSYRALHDLFSESFAYIAPVPFGVSLSGRTERTWGQLVTPSYFSTLGVHPLLGRLLDQTDEKRGGAPAAVISYQFWRERLGSDEGVVGKVLRINGYPCTVVGVGPDRFRGASPTMFPADLWLPVSVDPRLAPELAGNALERYDLKMFQVVGRLRPGVSEARAELELTAVGQHVAAEYGALDRNEQAKRVNLLQGGKVLPIRKQDLPFFKEFFVVLGGLVVLIACANVANMMLARATDRRREISVRLALGANRSRLVRQLLTESLMIAVGAALPAFLLCMWLMRLASRMRMPLPIPMALDLTPDWRALLFTLSLTGLAALAFGLVPALQATRTDLVSALKEGGNVQVGKHRRLNMRNGLVLGQMALSLTLLLMTGYMGLGIQSTLGVQEGFDPRNLWLISLDPVRDGYSPRQAAEFLGKLLDRVKKLPGVTAACLTDTLPVATDGNAGVRFSSAGAAEHYWAKKHIVGRDYFETAGIQIVAGRGFRREDEESQTPPVIVTQEAVRQFWKDHDPMGRRIEISNEEASGGFGLWPGTIDYRANVLGNERQTFEVIGVARDVSEDLLASKKHPAIYFPLNLSDYAQPSLRGMTLMLRGAPGVDVISAVRHEVSAMDANLTPFNGRSMVEQIDQFMSALKGASWTYGLIGLFGLVLAVVGVAGVTAYSVAKRGHEIGIRMALGAQKRNVLALVMSESAVLVIMGTVGGLALAWAGIRGLSSFFFSVASVRTADPVLLVGAPVLLGGLALLACYLPARRAMQVDPVIALRQE